MKLDFYSTKRYTYIVADNVTFRKREKGYPQVNEVPFERVDPRTFTYSSPVFSIDIEHEVDEKFIKEGYAQFCEFSKNTHRIKKMRMKKKEKLLKPILKLLKRKLKEVKYLKQM